MPSSVSFVVFLLVGHASAYAIKLGHLHVTQPTTAPRVAPDHVDVTQPTIAPRVAPDHVVASAISRRRAVAEAGAAAATAWIVTPLPASAEGYPRLSIKTTEGEMTFDLWDDVAPKHVASFLKLAKEGFFDGGAFHRIIPGFVIQGGDPNAKVGYGPGGTLDGADKKLVAKWGRGGPGYNVPAEFNERIHEFGVLSMARAADPNSAGSQFFVCLGRLTSLDRQYTTFGKLTSGDDVLKRIAAAQTVAGDIPFKRQGIERVDAL